jgi:hypothetical protein
MARGRRLLGRLGLVLVVTAAAFVGAKLGLLGTREVGASRSFADAPAGAGELTALSPRLRAGSLPQVVDATGRAVGRTISVAAAGATVAMLVQGRWFFVPVTANGFSLTPPTPELFFPGVTDCSGEGFFVYVNALFTNSTVVRVKEPGRTVYVADVDNPRTFPPTSGSAEGWANPPCRQVGFAGIAYPAVPLLDLETLGFQTPFGLL